MKDSRYFIERLPTILTHQHTPAVGPPPETWITAPEAAAILHLTLRTVLNRAASDKLPARIPEDMPFTYDGKQNYLICLEGLPQKAQFEYLPKRLPASQRCGLDLATPRSSFGDAWLSTFLDAAQLIRSAEQIRQRYRHSGKAAGELRKLAETNVQEFLNFLFGEESI